MDDARSPRRRKRPRRIGAVLVPLSVTAVLACGVLLFSAVAREEQGPGYAAFAEVAEAVVTEALGEGPPGGQASRTEVACTVDGRRCAVVPGCGPVRWEGIGRAMPWCPEPLIR